MKKLAIRIVPVIILGLLASPLVFIKGCGKAVNGGQCGGCPDTTAPTGSSITASEDRTETAFSGTAGCFNYVTFNLKGPDGQPLNDICVEVFTDGLMKPSSIPGSCTDAATAQFYTADYMRTRTDGSGNVVLDFATPTLTCAPGAAANSTETQTFFVQASSCAVTQIWTATITVTCQ